MLAVSVMPAVAADHKDPTTVIVEPGELVQIIDGIFISVEPNGTVSIIDGIFVEKVSTGGQPATISIANERIEMTVIPGVCLDLKC